MDSEETPLDSPARLSTPFGSFRGPNSLLNFASSFTRAQLFAASQIDSDIHRQRSFFIDNADELYDADLGVPLTKGERLLVVVQDMSARNALFASGAALDYTQNEVFYQDDAPRRPEVPHQWAGRLQHAASFASVPSLHSRRSTLTLAHITDAHGNAVTVAAGQSTAPQTVFNSINVLIGVGLLALPVGLLRAGWIFGLPLLIACAAATYWLAGLLSKAMDTDRTIMTYADIGHAAYGPVAKLVILVVFCADLLGAGVALVVLFSDLLHALLGGDSQLWSKNDLKMLAFAVLTPFSFFPLPILLVFSLAGIVATISLTVVVAAAGFAKTEAPGSLWMAPMETSLWPSSSGDLLLALGVLMAPFGGHAVFPSLKADMRHPYKFTSTLLPTYVVALAADASMGVVGLVMFGSLCANEITSNVLLTKGFPAWCYPLVSALICCIPLAKTPLNARPIVGALETLLSVQGLPTAKQNPVVFLVKGFLKVLVNFIFVLLAVVFPEFDRIIGMLGSSVCFLVCIILPALFYLKLCLATVGPWERFFTQLVAAIATVLAVLGTWATLSV